jgi:hypothetical protein
MNKNINSKEIFSIGLGLCAPWFIENVAIDDENIIKELHIYINFQKGYKFSVDGHKGSAYDTEDKVWQHLDFFSIDATFMLVFHVSNCLMARFEMCRFLGQG